MWAAKLIAGLHFEIITCSCIRRRSVHVLLTELIECLAGNPVYESLFLYLYVHCITILFSPSTLVFTYCTIANILPSVAMDIRIMVSVNINNYFRYLMCS